MSAVKLSSRRSIFWMVGLAITLTGCGPSDSAQGVKTVGQFDVDVIKVSGELSKLVDKVQPSASSASEFGNLFVEPGKAPQDRTDYQKYLFGVDQIPQLSGNTAKAAVKLGDKFGGEFGSAEWTFTLVGQEWKIAAAPLPKLKGKGTGGSAATPVQNRGDRD